MPNNMPRQFIVNEQLTNNHLRKCTRKESYQNDKRLIKNDNSGNNSEMINL